MDTIRSLYDTDFVRWAEDQAARLRAEATLRPNVAIDWEHLAEELEELSGRTKRELTSYLKLILEHLLKLEVSPDADPRRGWVNSVLSARDGANDVLDDNPSLRPALPGFVEKAYRRAVRDAARGLAVAPSTLPEPCPYTLAQILDEAWLPRNRHGLPDPEP